MPWPDALYNGAKHFLKSYSIFVQKLFHKTILTKDFRAFGVALVRHMTAATAAVTLARPFTEWLYYVLGRLHSSYVLSTRISPILV